MIIRRKPGKDMFKRILNFFEKILKRKTILIKLEEGQNNQNKKDQVFKKELKFDDGKESKKLIQEILTGKEDLSNLEDVKEKMIEYIDKLIKRVDKCQNDIAIAKSDLQKINNQLM